MNEFRHNQNSRKESKNSSRKYFRRKRGIPSKRPSWRIKNSKSRYAAMKQIHELQQIRVAETEANKLLKWPDRERRLAIAKDRNRQHKPPKSGSTTSRVQHVMDYGRGYDYRHGFPGSGFRW